MSPYESVRRPAAATGDAKAALVPHPSLTGEFAMRWVLLVLIELGFALPVRAGDPAEKQNAAPSPPSARFVADAAAGALFEIKSGKLVLARSKSETVRALANRMVADHTAAFARLKQVVGKETLAAPSDQLDAKHKAILEDLNNTDDASFDKAYIETQYKVHLEALDLFKAYAKGTDNAALKRYAAEMVPTLQAHLEQISKLRGQGA
jgi:putative membrane protein